MPIRVLSACLLAAAFLYHSAAYSAEYTWSISYEFFVTASSPAEACQQWANLFSSRPKSDWNAVYKRASKLSDLQFVCFYDAKSKTSADIIPDVYTTDVYRSGDSCPPDTIYNTNTGACEVDQCAATAGTEAYHLSATG